MGWEIKKKQKQENDKCLREGNRFRQNFNLYLIRAAIVCIQNAIRKTVYKEHSSEPEYNQLPFIYRLKLYALFIQGKH